MAYPPPALATTRTDSTQTPGTHPADHNAANLAINDIVAQLGALQEDPVTVRQELNSFYRSFLFGGDA